MTNGFIAGLLVAFFGSAVGALLGQFLRFYSQRINDIENMVNTLQMIEDLDAGTVNWTAKRRDAPVWQLRNRLYSLVLSSRNLLSEETNKEVNEVLSTFDKIEANTPTNVSSEDLPHTHYVHNLNDHASDAIERIEQVGWWQCARLFFLPNR